MLPNVATPWLRRTKLPTVFWPSSVVVELPSPADEVELYDTVELERTESGMMVVVALALTTDEEEEDEAGALVVDAAAVDVLLDVVVGV